MKVLVEEWKGTRFSAGFTLRRISSVALPDHKPQNLEGSTVIVGSPTTKVIRSTADFRSGRSRSAQNPNRQQNYRANKFKRSFNRDT
jgi:hypothetical protein